MFANTQMGGMDTGFPDVCLTPAPPAPAPVPIPYPNIAAGPMGVPAAYNVLMSFAPAHNMATTVPLTNGDNSGVMMGVASGTEMGPERPLMGRSRASRRYAGHAPHDVVHRQQHQLAHQYPPRAEPSASAHPRTLVFVSARHHARTAEPAYGSV